jgi:peroxiredoxin
MKNIKFFVMPCLVSLLLVCCQPPKEEGFLLTGEISGYGQGRIVIIHHVPQSGKSDTIEIINDRFEYRGEVQSPYLVFFRILGNEVLDRPFAQGFFMVENANMHFVADVAEIHNFSLSGSPSHDDLKAIYGSLGSVGADFSRARTAYRQAVSNQEDAAQLQSDMNEKREDYIGHLESFIHFETSHAMAYIIYNNYSNFTRPQIKQLLSKFSDELNHNVYLSYMRDRIESEESIAVGVHAPDFTLYDPEGNEYSVTDFRGKHLLLAFSASWCTWCKKETPYMKAAYEQFKISGLEVLTINLDTTRELWLSDIAEDNLPWPVVSDLQAFKGDVVKDYAIFAIPRIFLIAPDGMILGMNLRGDQILEAVRKAMN